MATATKQKAKSEQKEAPPEAVTWFMSAVYPEMSEGQKNAFGDMTAEEQHAVVGKTWQEFQSKQKKGGGTQGQAAQAKKATQAKANTGTHQSRTRIEVIARGIGSLPVNTLKFGACLVLPAIEAVGDLVIWGGKRIIAATGGGRGLTRCNKGAWAVVSHGLLIGSFSYGSYQWGMAVGGLTVGPTAALVAALGPIGGFIGVTGSFLAGALINCATQTVQSLFFRRDTPAEKLAEYVEVGATPRIGESPEVIDVANEIAKEHNAAGMKSRRFLGMITCATWALELWVQGRTFPWPAQWFSWAAFGYLLAALLATVATELLTKLIEISKE